MDPLVLEVGLALTLAAIAAGISATLRFSVVPFLILAGLAVGPHVPPFGLLDLRFVHSAPLLAFLGRFGLLLLLFYLGLEFSVGRLLKAGRTILTGGTLYISINLTLGLLIRQGIPDLDGAFARRLPALHSSEEAEAMTTLYAQLPSTNSSYQVLATQPANLALLSVQGVVWSDWGEPSRVLTSLARMGKPVQWAEPAEVVLR